MSSNRFIALLVILSIIAILVTSNWSVALPLAFLGTQTRSLPLGIWLLLSFSIGLGVTLILQLLRLPEARQTDFSPQKSPRRSDRSPKSSRPQPPPTYNEEDDWEAEPPPKSEEWDFEPEGEEIQDRVGSYSDSYEVNREPTAKNVSGSVYSYSYRQPQDSGFDRSEAVRDASYRVINPPSREPIETAADDDDWGFDFDDEESDRR